MTLISLIRIIAIGFSVAAAVGPISLLCIQRVLRRGWRVGLVSGIGVASADAVYGLIGGLGLTVIINFLTGQQTLLRFVGGAVLILLGIRIFLSKAELKPGEEQTKQISGYLGDFISIFLLTLSNPMTIISFAAIYAGLGGMGLSSDQMNPIVFSLGIFLGSTIWWLLLVGVIHQLRSRFNPGMLDWLNRFSGVVIAGFGFVILGQALIDWMS